MQYKLICDYRENFESVTNEGYMNDHQDKETFLNILHAIRKSGYECEIMEGVPSLLQALDTNTHFDDTIFLNLSDGMSQKYSRTQIPVLCELLQVPYSGGNVFAVALTSNKHYTKLAVEKLGIHIPQGILITKQNQPDELTLKTLRYPLIVKPNAEGSSVGITPNSICKTQTELQTQIDHMLPVYSEVLAETFIPGYDVTDFIIGNKGNYYLNEPLIALKKGEVIHGMDVMSYKDYIKRDNWYASPEKYLSKICIDKIQNMSKDIVEHLETYDIARIDYRVTANEDIYFLEVNTVPAVHSKSQAGAICQQLGISFVTFVSYWIQATTQRLFGSC